ncbi:MAG: hypothetical protein KIT31_32065 [Deltaproteobacteria bacterium]|nr:hypothetical protein [Deltaproteobacteria bacterium]
MGKQLERVGSIVWGIVFLVVGIGLAGLVAAVPHDGWSAWDWTWRIGGILVLVAAGVGSLLPDDVG